MLLPHYSLRRGRLLRQRRPTPSRPYHCQLPFSAAPATPDLVSNRNTSRNNDKSTSKHLKHLNKIGIFPSHILTKICIFPSHILPCVLQPRRFPETLSQHQLNKTVLLAQFLSSRKEKLLICQRHCNGPTTINGAPSTLRGMVGEPLSCHFSDHHIHP